MTKLHKDKTLYVHSFLHFGHLPSNCTVVFAQPVLGSWLKEGCAWQFAGVRLASSERV